MKLPLKAAISPPFVVFTAKKRAASVHLPRLTEKPPLSYAHARRREYVSPGHIFRPQGRVSRKSTAGSFSVFFAVAAALNPPRLLALICRKSSAFLSRLRTRSGRHEVRVSSPRPREGRPQGKAHLRRILHPAARVLNRRFLALHRRNNAVPSIANARREICRLHNSASPPKPRGIRRQINAPQRLFMPERPAFAAKEAQKKRPSLVEIVAFLRYAIPIRLQPWQDAWPCEPFYDWRRSWK